MVFFAFLLIAFAEAKCTIESFDDRAFTQWMKAHPNSLILVVSNGMPYSIQSIASIQREVRDRKIELAILSDSKDQKKTCYPILTSEKLIQKGGLRHFPTLFLVKNGKLYPKLIPGIQTDPELRSHLDPLFPQKIK